MLSINADERLITMRMCAMGIIAGKHTIPSPEYLAKTAAQYADAILQEHRKTSKLSCEGCNKETYE